eukprot:CAMPEP_0194135644 /NCGR_PEP_ID=MMETSP0152-20130528/5750_1 /TAXON_ID=1049557 /ORGANISM="Thalassiothrix antarctica, Strain L6-D1" /LENGTH=216 /DNA_ID=CAMNT_0038831981 /DNA_START=165 /DNA_END=815 /DNA_ORIENTATION=+
MVQVFENCEDKAIQIANMSVSCDSPYTFYYGNGANRDSPICDYGDKATITVGFYVMDDIDDTIYMQMSAYNPSDEQLYLGESVELCEYVGVDCNYEGYYEFSKQVQFAYLSGNESKFVPSWEIAFSEGEEGAYDMGAINIECEDDSSNYFDWVSIRTNSTMTKVKTADFLQEYGILLGTCVSLLILGVILIKATSDKIEYRGDNQHKTQLLDEEMS